RAVSRRAAGLRRDHGALRQRSGAECLDGDRRGDDGGSGRACAAQSLRSDGHLGPRTSRWNAAAFHRHASSLFIESRHLMMRARMPAVQGCPRPVSMNELAIKPDDLGKGSPIKLQIVPDAETVTQRFAAMLAEEYRAAKAQGREKVVFIVPVGPVGQF